VCDSAGVAESSTQNRTSRPMKCDLYRFSRMVAFSLLLLMHVAQAQRDDTPLDVLSKALDTELRSRALRNALVGVEISDVRGGTILYSRNADMLLRPASTTKLLTSAAALLRLPDNAGFTTRLRRTASGGTLICVGGGDPMFSMQDMEKLADFARDSAIARYDTLLLDPSVFDSTVFGEGWMWDDEADPFMPALSPFCLERNIARINVSKSTQRTGNIAVDFDPPSSILSWSRGGSSGETVIRKLPRGNHFVIHGAVPATPVRERFAIWDPRAVFADVLRTKLLQRGLVDSTVVLAIGGTEATVVELGAIVRPLDEVLAEMNKQSDNLCAEMTLRLLGTSLPGGAASAKSGLEAMHAAFRDKGLPTGPLALVDGSGISFYNLVGVGFLGKVLRLMAVQTQFERYRSTLAVPGGEGTMRNRLQGEKRVAGVRMKTGTLRGVSTLAGYVQAPGGRLLAVVLFMQNFTGSHTPFREAQDRMVRHCLDYSASPQNTTRPR